MKKKILAFALSMTLLGPVASQAGVCWPLVIDVGMIAMVTVIAGLDASAAAIIESRASTYKDNAEDISATEREIQASIESGVKGSTSSLASSLQQHAVATEVDKNVKTYSPTHGTSVYSCPTEIPEALSQGTADRHSLKNEMTDAFIERENTGAQKSASMKDIRDNWSAENAEDVVLGDNIFPTDETLTEDQVIAAKLTLEYIANPVPSEQLNQNISATGIGKQHEIIKTVKSTRLSPALHTYATIISNSAPVYDLGDWEANFKSAASNPNSYSKDGKLSANAILALRTETRFNDANYHTAIHEKNQKGLFQELVVIKSVKLEILKRRVKAAQHTRVLLATKLANKLEKNYSNAAKASLSKAISRTN